MFKKAIISIIFFSLFTSLLLIPSDAHSLRIILKRVVLEGGKRAENLTLINASQEPLTYRLEWRHLVMTETQGLNEVAREDLPPNVRPSADFVRYAPRRVTIPPASAQTVRLILRMPAGVEDGEYRSHLSIRQEVDPQELRAKLKDEFNFSDNTVAMGVTMLPGITIPVIVRKGNLDADIDITGARAEAIKGGSIIKTSIDLARTGNKSTYGDFDFLCNPGDNAYPLTTKSGVAVYTEIERKTSNFRLRVPKDEAPCRNMIIRYTEMDGVKGEPVEIMDEIQVAVQ